MKRSDLPSLSAILQDKDVMYAYEHAFSDEEVSEWLEKQLKRYQNDGFGLWAVILKQTNEMIGQCGLTVQEWNDTRVLEIGYLFQKAYWHNGYAAEAAMGCKNYAFERLDKTEVFSFIRDTNHASRRVAERVGMQVCGNLIKHYYDMDMPHLVYSVKRS